VTSPFSLFACAASEVTLERVRELLDQTIPESLTLEYKRQKPQEVARSVAAMANSYGGIVLVGVADDRSLVGVPEAEQVSIVNACHDTLEPPWQPEVIALQVPEPEPLFLLVLRIDHERAPRPILVRGAAPIRLPGRAATANRGQLRQLFQEGDAPSATQVSRMVQTPQLPQRPDGEPVFEFILRSGLTVPINTSAFWRPISEAAGNRLSVALGSSALGALSPAPFLRNGLNRARRLRLMSSLVDAVLSASLEVVVTVDLPSPRAAIDNCLRVAVDLNVTPERAPSGARRIGIGGLYALIDALFEAFTNAAVVEAVADIAGIATEVVPQPVNLEFAAGHNVDELLDQGLLHLIPGAGSSRGASLIVNPSNDLRVPMERASQVDDFLREIAMDAGLEGMEACLSDLHKRAAI
jgi:hypothetical protein